MPERFPIGADVVEAAMQSWPNYPADGFPSDDALRLALEAAVRAALDKLGLREEQREPILKITKGRIKPRESRLVSDWRQVDAEPADCVVCQGADPDCGVCTQAQVDRHRSVRVDTEPSEPDRVANDLCGDVIAERDRLRRALERADTLLMAAKGALGRAIANRANPDRTLDDALQDVKARLAAVSDTTLTALHEGPSATSEPSEPSHNGIPDSYWREVPCGHPPDPVAMRNAQGTAVCHCGRGLALVGDSGLNIKGAPGDVFYCDKCGCHVAVPVQRRIYETAWRDARDYYGAARPDGLSDFPVEALEALKDLVMPLEGLPQSDRLLWLIEKALEAKAAERRADG